MSRILSLLSVSVLVLASCADGNVKSYRNQLTGEECTPNDTYTPTDDAPASESFEIAVTHGADSMPSELKESTKGSDHDDGDKDDDSECVCDEPTQEFRTGGVDKGDDEEDKSDDGDNDHDCNGDDDPKDDHDDKCDCDDDGGSPGESEPGTPAPGCDDQGCCEDDGGQDDGGDENDGDDGETDDPYGDSGVGTEPVTDDY